MSATSFKMSLDYYKNNNHLMFLYIYMTVFFLKKLNFISVHSENFEMYNSKQLELQEIVIDDCSAIHLAH